MCKLLVALVKNEQAMSSDAANVGNGIQSGIRGYERRMLLVAHVKELSNEF